MGSKQTGIGLYEFLIESELQQYYNAIKNDLKVQSVHQLKYVSDDDMVRIGMSRPEIRRLQKYFQKHCPQTYLAKMKKKLRFRRDDGISVASLSSYTQNAPGRLVKSIAPGRHIIQAESLSMSLTQTLGSGEFGTVQQGVWTSDDGQRTQVAIKCLSQERMENNPVEFLKEAAIMHTVDHEHIVRLYGVVLDTSALMLVTELAPLRSLLECLKEPSMRPNLGVPTLYDFAVQICDGMQYLESKRLIHRDLAARNILVFSRNKVKISDFGLSRALGVGKDYYQTNFNVNLKLPIAWCAPECINFLRFTSASDVWAYSVTLWEMFSYGFQPWAALTGQQILESIDEPNYQRLEKPECCPNEIYYQIMLKCWQHDPLNRPSFAQLSHLILECKPEQVQAIRESDAKPRRDFLVYDAGDIITVLDKKPPQTFDEIILWKGVLKCGKSGLFYPANTIQYLGSSLPSVNKQSQSPFHRNDSRSSSMRKGRISADMISGPQGDLKHTGHVGPDGQFFGDLTFLGSKCWVPRQVVPPYKPESSDGRFSQQGSSSSTRITKESHQDLSSSDTVPLLSTDDGSKTSLRRRHMVVAIPGSNYNAGQDHEYHEISDEENEMMGAMGGCRESSVGLSNPALSSQSPLDSPRFDKSFDLELGPSLIDEVFSALQQQPDEAHNVKNELREMARSKKKFASVKPISSSDRRTLDHAIAIANELASRSMVDLDRSGKNCHTNNSLDDLSSNPRTPNSPSHRRKFSFILSSGKNSDRERRNYSAEAASIPDIQSTLTEEAKEAYNSLVEKPSMNTLGFLTPSYENKSMSFHFPEKCSSLSKKADFFEQESNTFNGPPSLTEMSSSSSSLKPHNRSLSLTKSEPEQENCTNNNEIPVEDEEEVDGNPLRLIKSGQWKSVLRNQNKQSTTNVLPLPPRDRKPAPGSQSSFSSSRHQRKHPLLIPNRISTISSSDSTFPIREPPIPPAKPIRQNLDQDRSRDQTGPLGEVSQDKKESQPIVGDQSTITNPSEVHSLDANKNTPSSNSLFTGSLEPVLLYENVSSSNGGQEDSDIISLKSCNHLEECATSKENVPLISSSVANFNRMSCSAIGGSSIRSCQSSTDQNFQNQAFKSDEFCSSASSVTEDKNMSTNTPTVVVPSPSQPTKINDKFSQVHSIKIKTLQRILGPSTQEEDCAWALNVTEFDSAHAVKLLRLKSLLPEYMLLKDNPAQVLSVLEMSHWDVARASSFLLNNSNNKSTTRGKLRTASNSSMDSTFRPPSERNEMTTDVVNNNSSLTSGEGPNSRSYIRPTHV